VLPEGDDSPEKIIYQAASPDEEALVTAAKNFGFFFYRCAIFTLTRRIIKAFVKSFILLAVLEAQLLCTCVTS